MVARLIRDAVSRQRLSYLFPSIQVILFSRISVGSIGHIDPLALTMVAAVMLLFTAFIAFAPVMFNTLPITRRTLWQSGWWLATVVPSAVAVLAVVIGQLTDTGKVDLGQTALSFVYCVLYTGLGASLRTTRLAQSWDKPVQPGRFMNVMVSGLPFIIVVFGAPFLIAPYLPHTIAEVTGPWVLVGLALAALVSRGYLYQPPLAARQSFRVVRKNPSGNLASPGTLPKPPRRADRLTGLRLPLWEISRKYFITYATVLVLGIAWWWVTSFYQTVPALAVVLGQADMLPFASRTAHGTEALTVGSLYLIVCMVDMMLVTNVRPLRTLPLSSNQLSAIPFVLGLLSATTLWIVFLLLHGIVLGTLPVSPRADLFAAFAGLSAFTQMLRLTLPGHIVIKGMVSIAPLGILWLFLGDSESFHANIVQPAMLAGGIAMLAASFAVMRRVVTHSSRFYRPQFTAVRFGS